MSYDQDLAEPLQAVENATWLLKPDDEVYKKVLEEYREGRADRFTMLVNIVAQPDQDVSSAWKACIDFFPVTLGQIKATFPLAESDQHLELNDWCDRETTIYEALKAEKFLQARQSLIARKVLLTEAAKTLNELTVQFFKENGERNAEMDEAAAETRKKVAEFAEKAALSAAGAAAATHGTLQELVGMFSALCFASKFVLDQYGKYRETQKKKQEANGPLTQIYDALGDLAKENQEEKVRSIVDEATIEAVAGSEDFSKFIEDLIERWKTVHVEPAEAAAKEFGESLRNGIGDHSEEKKEEITKLKFLTEQRDEIVGTLESIESTTLTPFDTAMNELLREGDEAQELRELLQQVRDNLREAKEKADSDLEENQAKAESLAQLLTFE